MQLDIRLLYKQTENDCEESQVVNFFEGGWRDTSDAISMRHLISKPRYVSMFPASCVSISNMVRCVFCGTVNEEYVSEIKFMCDTVS